MRTIKSAAEQLAFKLAIDRAETTLGGERWPPAEVIPEAERPAQRQARRDLPPGVRSFEKARAARLVAEAATLEALAVKAGLPAHVAARLADGLRAQAPNDWTFVMLSPSQNSAVVGWLDKNSSRPQAAMRLWARLFEVIRNDTGEIMQSREELARWLGVEPKNLSTIMSELATINAVRREKRGREVRYFMNSNIATHLPGPAAREAARASDGPVLHVVRSEAAE